jgi:hypothetical protein
MASALVHLIHGDYEALANYFSALGLMRSADLDMELPELSAALQKAFQGDSRTASQGGDEALVGENTDGLGNLQLDTFSFIGVAEKLIELGGSFPLQFRDYFLSILRSLAMLEGLALNADPSFRIMRLVYPYVMSLILSDPSPHFREALINVCTDASSRIHLDTLERVVRLSRPNLPEASSTSSSARQTLGFLSSPNGRFARQMLARQTATDCSVSIRDWIDRLIFRRSSGNKRSTTTSGSLHRARMNRRAISAFVYSRLMAPGLRRRARGFAALARFAPTAVWIAAVVTGELTLHVVRRILGVSLEPLGCFLRLFGMGKKRNNVH